MNIQQDYKKASYYLVALVSFFFLCWSTADIVSAGINLAFLRPHPPITGRTLPQETPSDGSLDSDGSYDYIYKQKILDRMGDSAARLLVSGIVFAMSRKRIRTLEVA